MKSHASDYKELTPDRERALAREALAQARIAMHKQALPKAAVLMRSDGLLKVVYGELLDCLEPRHPAYLLTVCGTTEEDDLLEAWRDARS
jgi:hypothetical protein